MQVILLTEKSNMAYLHIGIEQLHVKPTTVKQRINVMQSGKMSLKSQKYLSFLYYLK